MDRVLAELDRIDAEAAQKRQRLLETEGIPLGLLLRFRLPEENALTPRPGYATVSDMPSTETVTEKHPGPIAAGPMGRLAKDLGLPSLAALAKALGEEYDTVRSWNREDRGAPSRAHAKIDKLRTAKVAERAAAKRKG